MKTNTLILVMVSALLAGCALPDLFYIGNLDSHDRAIFREAASMEGAETIDWPAPGAWIVTYGAPQHQEGETWPGAIFLKESQDPVSTCPRDQQFLVSARHELGHSRGESHSANPNVVMHFPSPCYPTD